MKYKIIFSAAFLVCALSVSTVNAYFLWQIEASVMGDSERSVENNSEYPSKLLSVRLGVNPISVNVGEGFTYTVSLSNVADIAAEKVLFSIPYIHGAMIPVGFDGDANCNWADGEIAVESGQGGSATRRVTCDIGTIEPNGKRLVLVKFKVGDCFVNAMDGRVFVNSENSEYLESNIVPMSFCAGEQDSFSSSTGISSDILRCAQDGEKIYGMNLDGEFPTSCCSRNAGHKPISIMSDKGMCITPSGGAIAICEENWWQTCGDGRCGEGEDICTCPADCSKRDETIMIRQPVELLRDPLMEMCGTDEDCRERIKLKNTEKETYEIKYGISTGENIPPAGYEDEVLVNADAYENPFPDTDVSALEGKAAAELYRRAVLGGFPDGEFKGDRPVNRAEAAKFLLLTRFESIGEERNNGRFPDVMDGQWYTKFVVAAAQKGIINGHPGGFFKPADPVNTAEFLKMLANTFNLEIELEHSYNDVQSNAWFAPYVGIAHKYQLFPDRGNTLMPERNMTRKEVAIAIYQYLQNR